MLIQEAKDSESSSVTDVLLAFLKLGLTSFGGPIAHLGYFREEFVVRRRWLDEQAYADLVAICQFVPGPASSQVGFAIGLMRAGYLGAIAAWAAFTLPSAAALVLFAQGLGSLNTPVGAGVLHGLKIVAVAIVAQAIWGMARTLCPDRQRASIAVVATLIVVFSASALGQIAAIVFGAVCGMVFCRAESVAAAPSRLNTSVSRPMGIVAIALFFTLVAILPMLSRSTASDTVSLFDAFFRAGALVFGGGHVVLPLLRDGFVGSGLVANDAFLAGYGAAQAVPGPLFTFSAYLGAVAETSLPVLAAVACALLGIFLPGMLILIGVLPFWRRLQHSSGARRSMAGVNAAVVGLLIAAFYDPVWTTTVSSGLDFGIALIGFALLTIWRTPPWAVVMVTAVAGAIVAV